MLLVTAVYPRNTLDPFIVQIDTNIILGEHIATMHEEYAWELYQAQAHHTRRIHLCWPRFMDTAGNNFKYLNCDIFLNILIKIYV